MQDHVHPGQSGSSRVLLLAVETDRFSRFISDLEQQRTGAAGRVVGGGGRAAVFWTDPNDFGDDPADFGRRIELAFAFAALGGEMPHQVFICITKNIVAIGAVFAEIQRFIFKNSDQAGQPVNHFLAAAKLGRIVEIGHVGEFVGASQRFDDFFVDIVTDGCFTFQRNHVIEARTFGNYDWRIGYVGVFVADIFDKQQHQHIVLVLTGIHAPAQFIATRPYRAVQTGFLDRHS